MERRKLKIKGSMSNLQKFIDNLPSRLIDGWQHDVEDEERHKKKGTTLKAIRTPKDDTMPEATIYLMSDGHGTLWEVTHVMPPSEEIGVIPVEFCNLIIGTFYEKFIKTQAADYSLTVEISPSEFTLDYLVSSNRLSIHNADFLRSVVHALESYGNISNPHDKDKFYDFVCGTFQDKQTISNHLLRTLLIDEFQIDEEISNELVSHYESLTQFLYHYAEFEFKKSAKNDSDADSSDSIN